MKNPTRQDAWTLLTEYTPSQALRRHALSVEASMRQLARAENITAPSEIERWGILGLIHDFDYERFPTAEGHPLQGMEILRSQGWAEDIIQAIGGHAPYLGIPRETRMAKALLAADELTGFLGACALVRPSKQIADVPVESVMKRLKEKSFAKTVDRDCVKLGAEEWGTPLPELIALLLASQLPIAHRLGLAGSPAPELDGQVPDLPAGL